MSACIKNLFLLLACSGLLATPVAAQTFTPLHSFTGTGGGSQPRGGLILSGNTLYGTTIMTTGNSGNGTVFRLNTDGADFTNLHSLAYSSDGGSPQAGLVLSGNTLYGTANRGGSSTYGTVFAVNTDSTGFTNLYNFTATSFTSPSTNTDGNEPYAGLIISGTNLFGTAYQGGFFGAGTVFRLNTDGTGFTNLHSFFGGTNEGDNPEGGLILSGNTLYGTTQYGGSSPNGTVFKVNTDGSDFTNVHNFTALLNFTNSDGANPYAGLILSGNTLYGTAPGGGGFGYGTVFAVNTDGTGFTNLHSFTAPSGSNTNTDGTHPYGGLALSGNTLYGTALSGGFFSKGAVFAVNTDGTGFTNLYNFTATHLNGSNSTNTDGAAPYAGLILSGNTLYGTASVGGSSGVGTVFSIMLPGPPSVAITTAGNKIVLSWPTNASGFTLQSLTNLSFGSWSNVTTGISTVGANYVFTNSVNGNAAFFRLMQ